MSGLGDQRPWWRDAVIYEIYVRSFADADGDGLGDLAGIRSRLPALADLGVDAAWLTPFYPSPLADGGYDVADYQDVDPRLGTLADFDALLATAHDLGLRVLIDVVPNHTSVEHAWFRAAAAGGPGAPERERYLFRPGRGPGGDEPPNDWRSVFGGPAWTRLTEVDGSPGPWYLHLFDSSQPDLDWTREEVRAAFDDVIAASQDKSRAVNEAQGFANEVVPRARGEASELRERAAGYKAARIADATGAASRFSALLGEYRKSPEVTRTRLYLETMEEVLPAVDKYIVEPGAGNVVPYLPLDRGRGGARGGAAVPAPEVRP